MKKLFLLALCFIKTGFTFSQAAVIEIKQRNGATIFFKTAIPPFYQGKENAFRTYIQNNFRIDNIKCGRTAYRQNYEVIVKYVVSKDGSLSDVQCEQDPGYGICEEALSLIKKLKSWSPAPNGVNVIPYRN